MPTLILKLGATGDVVRTTTVLPRLLNGRSCGGEVTWVTAEKNLSMVDGLGGVRAVGWERWEGALDREYDLVINLEDTDDVAELAEEAVRRSGGRARLFGAKRQAGGGLGYTEDAGGWFDLSLLSRFGRKRADGLKYENRRTYQDLLFEGLGWEFRGEAYALPRAEPTGLSGDVAISPVAGAVWPMKAWAYYGELQRELEGRGFTVNVLPTRATLLEHLGDVQGHRVLVSGDSLPMHLALGSGVRCVTLFNCTSPWEIHDYGLMSKLISPLLGEFFYQRGFDERATKAISLEEVLEATLKQMGS
ncbi:MAG: glycosyltransferase family 9 protein [Verrucomicrobiales bacterium]